MNFNKTYLIAFAVIAIAAGFTAWAFMSGMSRYVDIKTARTEKNSVQLRGFIVRDETRTPVYDQKLRALRFWMRDQNKEEMEVVYYGAKPDAFDSAPGTAAHGSIRRDKDGVERFHADSIVIQCPSKYNDETSIYKKTASN